MNRIEILERHKPEKDNMLGILHDMQDANPNNYLNTEDMKAVARYLNTTYSHVYGVATYYTMFSVKPRGKNIIRICNSPVCNMEGSLPLKDALELKLGIKLGESTSDMLFTLEYTECLGRCDESPSMMINRDIFGKVDTEELDSILGKYK